MTKIIKVAKMIDKRMKIRKKIIDDPLKVNKS